jgi:hypothetical protein
VFKFSILRLLETIWLFLCCCKSGVVSTEEKKGNKEEERKGLTRSIKTLPRMETRG